MCLKVKAKVQPAHPRAAVVSRF